MDGLDPAIRTGRLVEVQPDIRLHCAEAGREGAPPIVFVHGFPEFWYAWKDVLPAFADRWHAVAPDLRGFNLSRAPADPKACRADRLVGDLDGLIRAFGHERAVVVAHDWGGAVAWALAIARPERVSRLVILNAPHPVPFARLLAGDPAQQAASAYMNVLRAPGAEAALAADDFAGLERLFAEVSPAPWFDAETRAAYHAAWSRPGVLTGAVNYYRASPLYPPVGDDPGARRLVLDPADFVVRVPTCVLWGERDQALLPALLDGLDALVPELTVHRLPGCSHWLAHEAPERVAALIRAFVEA
ncbi:MAG TPA: alpha/beta fold hydrolase [Burkholderiaceae bacterium]|nr:alpha/beta fold hydrolase [Burkholderiaceae bacterium]